VLIVDGDFVSKSWLDKFCKYVEALQARWRPDAGNPVRARLADMHQSILSQVYFSDGAKSDVVSELLRHAGFRDITVQSNMADINRAQARHLPLTRSLARRSQHRYAISASKPAD